jgi:hypothetical protein
MDSEFLSLSRQYLERQPGAAERLTAFHVRTGFVNFKPYEICQSREKRPISAEPLTRHTIADGLTGRDFEKGAIAADVLRVRVSYAKGGRNYFHGGSDPRGYSLDVRVTYANMRPDGRIFGEIYNAVGSGSSDFLLEAKRFSAKVLDGIAIEPERLEAIKKRVLLSYRQKQTEAAQAEQDRLAGVTA